MLPRSLNVNFADAEIQGDVDAIGRRLVIARLVPVSCPLKTIARDVNAHQTIVAVNRGANAIRYFEDDLAGATVDVGGHLTGLRRKMHRRLTGAVVQDKRSNRQVRQIEVRLARADVG